MTFKSMFTLTPMVLATACTWVDTKPGAERVVMIDRYQAESCQRLGTTSAKTTDNLWLYERDPVKVRTELVTLARNQAAAMGGNALVSDKEAENGQQSFVIYRCP